MDAKIYAVWWGLEFDSKEFKFYIKNRRLLQEMKRELQNIFIFFVLKFKFLKDIEMP